LFAVVVVVFVAGFAVGVGWCILVAVVFVVMVVDVVGMVVVGIAVECLGSADSRWVGHLGIGVVDQGYWDMRKCLVDLDDAHTYKILW
jgi:hypothetical protein